MHLPERLLHFPHCCPQPTPERFRVATAAATAAAGASRAAVEAHPFSRESPAGSLHSPLLPRAHTGIFFTILGIVMFIPGFYYTRVAFYAYKDYKSFSFPNIPPI
ncbi:hypothetical protein C2845_PM18G04050 [Panicum miliaceum]|uniref:Transmembrane protein 230 n=1 Tax=Panicum miliaceum TaxID=4540 RepID=A0A3L6PLD0_PANMI|nr:hypothetical protein C2845_PM18G04050 [Panicum miliaceum]